MLFWSLLYSISLIISSLSAGAVTFHLYLHSHIRSSAVQFLLVVFFFYLCLWSLFRGIFYLNSLIEGDEPTADESNQGDGSHTTYHDAIGLSDAALFTDLSRPWLSVIVVMGDTALMASSLWMLPMTHELSKLARRSMDRGIQRERRTVRHYCIWIHVAIIAFFAAETVYTAMNKGFFANFTRVIVSGNTVQAVALVYVSSVLINLNLTGRKYASIQGDQVASPLYKRIRAIMVVYGLFSLQYQVITIILVSSDFDVDIPAPIIGISTLLFNNSGTALSIAIGCSQEWVFHLFQRYLPEKYADRLPTNMNNAIMPPIDIPLYDAPSAYPVFVYTDIESSTALWGLKDGEIMSVANELHDELIRALLPLHHGYEITTVGDAFQLAFHTIQEAVDYCSAVQFELLCAKWPKALHNAIPATKREKAKVKYMDRNKTIKWTFNGLRVRMGIHAADPSDGVLVRSTHSVTGNVTYTGMSEVFASEVTDVGTGGQICATRRVADWIRANTGELNHPVTVSFLGDHVVPQLRLSFSVYQITPKGLEARRPYFESRWKNYQSPVESRTSSVISYPEQSSEIQLA